MRGAAMPAAPPLTWAVWQRLGVEERMPAAARRGGCQAEQDAESGGGAAARCRTARARHRAAPA